MSKYLAIGSIVLLLFSCDGSGYEATLKAEYDKKVRNDSLFLGFSFGDTRQEFFTHGWEVNKKGLIQQGRKNNTVSHILRSEDGSSDIEMFFFPEFDDETKIKSMPMYMVYTGWAPWNRRLFSDSLLIAAKDTLMNWYPGNGFNSYTDEKNNVEVWYKVDGNRQITMGVVDEKEVKIVIKDMYHPDNDPFN